MTSVIGHFDLDYFYAQVEEVNDPELKSKPVVVCVFSGRTDDSGVVSTANYMARGYGVRSGVTISLAKKRLAGKDAVFVKMDREKYESVSDRIMEMAASKADRLEQTGIDEAFFDITRVTGGDYSVAGRLALDLKKSVFDAERLTCSVGIGRSKAVAKIASDYKKPDGLTIVEPDGTATFLGPLPANSLSGVGPKTSEELESIGIRTLGELGSVDIDALSRLVGRKVGVYLHEAANGIDKDPVMSKPPTQLGRIVTLGENTRDPRAAFESLKPAVKDLQTKISAEGISFRSVAALGILSDLSTKTRSKSYENPVSDPTVLMEDTKTLLLELFASFDKEFRRVGVRVSELGHSQDQTSLSSYIGEP